MNNIEKIQKVYSQGWCVKSFKQVVDDLNECCNNLFEGRSNFYGKLNNVSKNSNLPFGTLITEEEYLSIINEVDYDGVKFIFGGDDGGGNIQTLIKDEYGKYTWALGKVFYDKNYIKERFTSGDWVKVTFELLPEKTRLDLIEERLMLLELNQVKTEFTKMIDRWKKFSCLSYDDVIEIAKNCDGGVFYFKNEKDLQTLENTIKQKLSL